MIGRLLAFVLMCLPASAQMFNAPPPFVTTAGGPPPSYSGPADVVASATAWYGLRAYSHTLANAGATTTPVVDVRGSTTATGCTIYLKGDGTGNLDLTTSGAGGVGNQCSGGATTFCTSTNTSCTVSKWYDQSGALSCGGSACHIFQTTAADQPTFTFSGLSGLPVLTFNGTTQFLAFATDGETINQPWTATGVYKNTLSGTNGFVFGAGDGLLTVAPNADGGNLANHAGIYAGTASIDTTGTDNTWIAFAGIGNGASSVAYVDGSAGTPGSAGTRALSQSIFAGAWDLTPAGTYFTGTEVEAGQWGIAFNSTQASNMSANQRAYWGF